MRSQFVRKPTAIMVCREESCSQEFLAARKQFKSCLIKISPKKTRTTHRKLVRKEGKVSVAAVRRSEGPKKHPTRAVVVLLLSYRAVKRNMFHH